MAVITDISQLDFDKQYTYADYLKWQFTERVELIKGWINKMSPAPNRVHQTVLQNIYYFLHPKFSQNKCAVYLAPFDVRLPIKSKKQDTTVVQPDICIICDASKLDDQGCNGAPDLIVEILSPTNAKYDLETKFHLYEEAGVQEYWIVQPQEKSVLIYELRKGEYAGLKPHTLGEVVHGNLFPDLKISVDDIFANT